MELHILLLLALSLHHIEAGGYSRKAELARSTRLLQELQRRSKVEAARAAARLDDLQCSLDKYDGLIQQCQSLLNGLELTRLGDGLYYFQTSVSSMTSWASASDFCKLHGMDLVSIESELENNLIKDWLKQVLQYDPLLVCASDPYINSVFWTSLYDIYIEGVYMWAGTGEPVTYTDWIPGDVDPNAGDKDCGVIGLYKQSPDEIRWNDLECGENKRFICEVPGLCSELLRDIYKQQTEFQPVEDFRNRVNLTVRCSPPFVP